MVVVVVVVVVIEVVVVVVVTGTSEGLTALGVSPLLIHSLSFFDDLLYMHLLQYSSLSFITLYKGF